MASTSFSQTHSEARTLEGKCDALLSEYSALVKTPTVESPLANDIQSNLEQRSSLVETLFRLAYEPGSSTTMLHQAQRHSEILGDHKQAFKRLTGEIALERNRQNLLSSVRNDIEAHRVASAAATAAAEGDSTEYYGQESARIDEFGSFTDSLLNRAYETRNELIRQQATIKDVQRRILRVVSQFPGVNSLISKINTRQKRNSLVLAGTIVFCVCFVVFVR